MVGTDFRAITIIVILENLEQILDSNSSKKQRQIILSTFKSFYIKTKTELGKNTQLMDIAFELFESEWVKYQKNFSYHIGEIVNQPFIAFSCNFEDFIEGKGCI